MPCEEMPQGNKSLALILSINIPLHTDGAQQDGSHHKAEIAIVKLGQKKIKFVKLTEFFSKNIKSGEMFHSHQKQ